jgi:hypothetical protein
MPSRKWTLIVKLAAPLAEQRENKKKPEKPKKPGVRKTRLAVKSAGVRKTKRMRVDRKSVRLGGRNVRLYESVKLNGSQTKRQW